MRFASDIRRLTTAATFLVMALAPCARAQGADDEGRRNECQRAASLELRRCESEMGAPQGLATVLDGLKRPEKLNEASLPLTLIDEDLGYLQSAAERLSRAAFRDGPLDLKSVGKTASEVRKRAGRLRDSLVLPRPQKGARPQVESVIGDARQLREALRELSELLADAVRNPALRGYLLDPAMSAEAWRDLDEIVELSDRIKTGSEALVKAGR